MPTHRGLRLVGGDGICFVFFRFDACTSNQLIILVHSFSHVDSFATEIVVAGRHCVF